MPSPTYVPILDPELSSGAPETSQLRTKIRDNVLSATQGGVDAKPNGASLWLGKDSVGGGTQYGIVTDEMNVGKALKPDGLGGVHFV
jgi:hypothetical protein